MVMVEEVKHEIGETKTEVVEKRVKPTVIRRRSKRVEAAPSPTPGTSGTTPAETAAGAVSGPSIPIPTGGAEKAAIPVSETGPSTPATTTVEKGQSLAKPSEEERKIGVVGYIDLSAGQPVTKIKEDWRERFRKGPKRRKSRAEMEMDVIQRAGGLKQYAGVFTELEEGVTEEGGVSPSGDRVFRPIPSTRKKRSVRKEFKKTKITEPKAIKKIIRVGDGIPVSSLSQSLGVKVGEIISKLMGLGVTATVNQSVDAETASLVATDYGYTIEHTAFKEEDILIEPEAHASSGSLVARPPVVTVMGHVDHGKTSILDAIRKSNVAEGEAGGITQHIGAYEVAIPKGRVTFIDTPGHEAFTTMRARGAQVTDIVVLVVAADDGIMPQTIEAIDHAKAAEVPIIVAINKIDKREAQPDRVKQSFTEHGLVPEEWGGDVICVNTSAKTGEGIEKLIEMILLQAEMLELKADPAIRPKGVVVEARLDKGRGPVATVLVQEGTLKSGDYVVCGIHDGKVRAMFDADGSPVEEASLSKPVELLGLSGVPLAGDEVVGVSDERVAKLVSEQRLKKDREKQLLKPVHASLEDLAAKIAQGETKELGVVLKADVQGSVEAVSDALQKLSTDKVKLCVLHSQVGGITESDVLLASASNAIVLGFNVRPDGQARSVAERENVEIRCYRIIYEMIDEVRKAMEGLLAPLEKEVTLGSAQVKEIFKISKVGTVAGCQVVAGKIRRNALVRLLRDQSIVFEGKLSSLKRFKEDVREVEEGYECGVAIENYNDVKVGDVIEAYVIEKKAAKL